MAVDPKLMRTFIIVAEELSFSRAAVRMNVAQPWVSERLRRLEEQLGFRLLNRTSRSAALTPEGAAFLPHALAIADAISAAESAATELLGTGAKRFRLTSLDSYLSCPERQILIDRFVQANRTYRFESRWGSFEAVMPMLLNGETDIVFSSLNMIPDDPFLECQPVCTRRPFLLIPIEHPLAKRPSVKIRELSGCKIAVSPGHSNPYALQTTISPLLEAGAEMVPAPESLRSTVEHFARARRVSCLRWRTPFALDHHPTDMVLVPLEDSPITVTTALWRRHGPLSAGALAFWRSAAVFRRAMEAGEADPGFRAIKLEMERSVTDLG